jgi:lipid A 3-O-deacylase
MARGASQLHLEGDRVTSETTLKAAGAAIVAGFAMLFTAAAAAPAAAQLAFGTPATDPPRIELGAGAFDITPDAKHKDSETAAEFRGEYHFGDVFWAISPFIGASGTSDGAFYGYGGFGIDIDFGPNVVLTPNGAAGYFERGSGTKLGSWWEFRTGAELAWRFADQSRVGIAVNHTSNAGLTRRNPGEQSVVLTYSIPFGW